MERVRESNKLDFDSDFEIQVYKKLQERGYKVAPSHSMPKIYLFSLLGSTIAKSIL